MDTEETEKLLNELDMNIMSIEPEENYQTKEYLHEVTDRASCVQEMFSRLLQEHPAVEQNEKLNEEAEKVMDVLYSFYCTAGDLMFACQDE